MNNEFFFKYLRVLFLSESKMHHEIDRLIGAASAVRTALYHTQLGCKSVLGLELRKLKGARGRAASPLH